MLKLQRLCLLEAVNTGASFLSSAVDCVLAVPELLVTRRNATGQDNALASLSCLCPTLSCPRLSSAREHHVIHICYGLHCY